MVVVVAVHPQDSDTQLLAPGVNAIRELIARLVTVESESLTCRTMSAPFCAAASKTTSAKSADPCQSPANPTRSGC